MHYLSPDGSGHGPVLPELHKIFLLHCTHWSAPYGTENTDKASEISEKLPSLVKIHAKNCDRKRYCS